MATLYAHADTTLLAFLTDADARRQPDPPPDTAASLVVDEATNGALIADLRRSTDAYRLAANGTLTKSGQPVTVNPPGRHYQDRLSLAAIITKLDADQALSAPELRVVLRFLLAAQVG